MVADAIDVDVDTDINAVTAPQPFTADRCLDCPYSAQPCVGTYGPPNAEVVFVGEAPAAQEIKHGRPFIGPSGQLLIKIADKVGIPLDDCLITNTLRCRLPEDEKISPGAIKACNGRLLDEIMAHPRKLVVALGGSALRALQPNATSILNVRGQRFRHREGFIVLPTVHPSFVLRQGTALPRLTDDLRQVAQIIHGKGYDRGVTEWAVLENANEVRAAIKGLMQQPYLACDTESANLNPTSPLLAIGIAWSKNKVLTFPTEVIDEHRDLFNELFQHATPQWIWHNGKYDVQVLANNGIRARIDHDTFLLYGQLDETAKSASLKDLAATELGASEWTSDIDPWLGRTSERHKSKLSFQVIPRPKLHKYLASDCDNTLQLFPILRERVSQDKGIDRVYRRILIPASNFLREVEHHGIWIDPEETERLKLSTENKIGDLKTRLQSIAYHASKGKITDHNPNSNPQVTEVLYTYLKLKPRRDEVRYFRRTTRREDLERLEPHEYITCLMNYRRAVKAYGTYILRFGKLAAQSTDHRIRTVFNQNGTKTGRLSSRPNFLNISRVMDEAKNPDWVNVKRMMAASPGNVLIELDESQAELRALAALSGDAFLVDVYGNDRDLHSEVAIQLFGEDYTKQDRDIAKRMNFGIVYGLQAANLAYLFKMTKARAQELIDMWYKMAPIARRFLNDLASHAQRAQPVRSPFGRLRRWGLVTADTLPSLQNEAMNAPIQSVVSDIVLLSGIRVQPFLRQRNASVINMVYDSLLIEAPNDPTLVREIIEHVTGVMESLPTEVLGDTVPFKADHKVGTNWGLMAA